MKSSDWTIVVKTVLENSPIYAAIVTELFVIIQTGVGSGEPYILTISGLQDYCSAQETG